MNIPIAAFLILLSPSIPQCVDDPISVELPTAPDVQSSGFLDLIIAFPPADEPLPNPEIVKWQFEAQERERAIARKIDLLQEWAKTHPEMVHENRSANNSR